MGGYLPTVFVTAGRPHERPAQTLFGILSARTLDHSPALSSATFLRSSFA